MTTTSQQPGKPTAAELEATDLKETERIQAPAGGPGRGPMGGGMVGGKANTFWPSVKRLVRRMAPYKVKTIGVITLTVLSVIASAVGPRVLGRATDLIFNGLIGGGLPAGLTKEQAVDGLRANGEDKVADMVSGLDIVPGQGVDFDAVGQVLLTVLALYVGASIIAWVAGYLLNDVVQGTVRRMRDEVEDKVNALPLSYFDRQPRGELLSRVTNDIDNVSQTLQQTLSQLLTSILTVFAVLGMMFWISPVLALVALISVPISMVVTAAVMKRSQGMFVAQWRRTGRLNAHIEETFSGHALVKVYGRQGEAERVFAEENDELFKASFGAQFVSGLIMPIMMFVGNLNYVVIAVLGGLRVASGTMSLGDVQAFIQYTRQFTQPLTQVASMMNLMQSGVASAERVFELLDAAEQSADERGLPAAPDQRFGEVRFEDVSFSYVADRPLIEGLSLVAHPGQTVAIVGPTGAGKTTLVNLVERFYELDAAGSPSTASTSPRCRAPRCARRSGWCCRTPGCSRARSATTSPTAAPPPRRTRSWPRDGHLRRPLRALAAGGLRHVDRRGGRQPLGGRASAHHHRARLPGRARPADPRRGDVVGRHPHRAAAPARDGSAAHRPDLVRDRAPALHHPRRRPDPGDGGRRDRRAGQPRLAARRRRCLCAALPLAVRCGGRVRRTGH